MPKDKREAINTVYAFCRKTDDIADDINDSVEVKKQKLKNWRKELANAFDGKTDITLFKELQKVVKKFNIPHNPFFELINGVELDLIKNRYYNFNELKDYCYKVASTVGLMTIPIFGYKNKETEKFAINLGIALQLTNIIRDVNIDADLNRIYLPQNELEKFRYIEEDILNKNYNDNFKSLMKFQTDRALEFYEIADKNITEEDKPSLFTAKAMEYIYLRLLDKIEEEQFDVFSHKIRVSNFNKFFIALAVFLKYNFFYKWLNL